MQNVVMRQLIAPCFAALLLAGPALALDQPPIRNAQDAACRDDARNRVFGAPNPQGLSLWNLGAQLYHQCMARAGGTKGRTRQTRAE